MDLAIKMSRCRSRGRDKENEEREREKNIKHLRYVDTPKIYNQISSVGVVCDDCTHAHTHTHTRTPYHLHSLFLFSHFVSTQNKLFIETITKIAVWLQLPQ